MNRRDLIKIGAGFPLLTGIATKESSFGASRFRSRVRPGDRDWPSPAKWEKLKQAVGGRLLKPQSPLTFCESAPDGDSCREALRQIKNPFTSLTSRPSRKALAGWMPGVRRRALHAVAAENVADVVAAVRFARTHNLRLVIKGRGHSFFGASNAPDSLLLWTRRMDDVTVHDTFTPAALGRAGPGGHMRRLRDVAACLPKRLV